MRKPLPKHRSPSLALHQNQQHVSGAKRAIGGVEYSHKTRRIAQWFLPPPSPQPEHTSAFNVSKHPYNSTHSPHKLRTGIYPWPGRNCNTSTHPLSQAGTACGDTRNENHPVGALLFPDLTQTNQTPLTNDYYLFSTMILNQ